MKNDLIKRKLTIDQASANQTELRKQIVLESIKWMNTPWKHHANIMGVGVDCAQLILQVYAKCGLIEDTDAGEYTLDFAHVRDSERFLEYAQSFMTEIYHPKTADIVVFKYGRSFSHSAIITNYPVMIHAFAPAKKGVCYDYVNSSEFRNRDKKFFSFFE